MAEQGHSHQRDRQDWQGQHQIGEAHQEPVCTAEETRGHAHKGADHHGQRHGEPADGHGHTPTFQEVCEDVAAQLIGAEGVVPPGLGISVPECHIDRAHVLGADVEFLRVDGPDIGPDDHRQSDEQKEAPAPDRAFVFAELVPDVFPLAGGRLIRHFVLQRAIGLDCVFRGLSHSGSSGLGRRKARPR